MEEVYDLWIGQQYQITLVIPIILVDFTIDNISISSDCIISCILE